MIQGEVIQVTKVRGGIVFKTLYYAVKSSHDIEPTHFDSEFVHCLTMYVYNHSNHYYIAIILKINYKLFAAAATHHCHCHIYRRETTKNLNVSIA